MMPYESLIGLDVADDVVYQQYREAMSPILARYGGGFRYDFVIGRTLRSETEAVINRLFAFYFRDEAAWKAFLVDPEYVAVRGRYFDVAVRSATIIAQYER
jgi:uncharacterized protein (DUF1330 family)